jgi:hypothetical protein
MFIVYLPSNFPFSFHCLQTPWRRSPFSGYLDGFDAGLVPVPENAIEFVSFELRLGKKLPALVVGTFCPFGLHLSQRRRFGPGKKHGRCTRRSKQYWGKITIRELPMPSRETD